jgi:hypothetical protein
MAWTDRVESTSGFLSDTMSEEVLLHSFFN